MHYTLTYQNDLQNKGSGRFIRALILFLVALVAITNAVFSQDRPSPVPNTKTLATGSLVIAMDNVNQSNSSNSFNLKAYGLVVYLLNNNVKLKWIIKSGKPKDGIDFSVRASQIKPVASAAATCDFKAGPFVIQSADLSGVSSLIDSYNNTLSTGERVKVYQTNASVIVDERYDLTGFKPKAALLNNGGNWDIHRDFLLNAGVNSGMNSDKTSATNWTKAVASDLLIKCYTFASEAHWSENNLAEAKEVTDAVKSFLQAGGNVLAECAAVRTYENVGKFHSSGGINSTTENKFNSPLSTLVYPNADLAYSQFQGAVNISKGGSLKNWTYSGTLQNGEHDHVKGSPTNPNIGASVAKLTSSGFGGLLFYLGNHNFNSTTDLIVLNGQRMYLNAFLTPPLNKNQVCPTNPPPPTTPPPATGGGQQCYVSPTIPTIASANSVWTVNADGTITIRTTFAKTFVDNTYGTNAIGWGSKGHTFSNLVGSDHLQLALYDNANTKKLEFKLDYITASGSAYKTLGVSGGDGKMIIGNAADIVGVKTSLSENFNTHGYSLTTNSPATNVHYTPNSTYPKWIYEVWYEVTVKAAAFGASGFKHPLVTSVHASPSKTGNNTEVVNPGTCPVTPGTLSLGNQVWNDYDGDGKRDNNEPGIPGATISLYTDNNGDNMPDGAAIKTTITNAAGEYQFTNLSEGRYIASMPVLAGYTATPNTATSATSPSPDNNRDNDNNLVRLEGPNDVGGVLFTNAITLTPDQEPANDGDGTNGNNTLDLAQCGNGYIGDFVWNDKNGNGIQDAGEPGINGVTVTITFSDGTTAITRTDNYDEANNANNPMFDGYYNFKNLGGGTYKIHFTTPSGFVSSPANQEPTDQKDSDPVNGAPVTVTLAANQSDFTVDAGFVDAALPPPTTCPNLSLGNMVFNDLNGNGLKEGTEPGIGGLSVNLYLDVNGDNLADGASIATIITAADGGYYFGNLQAGKYIVGVATGSAYTRGANPNANADDNKDNDNNGASMSNGEVRSNSITLAAGEEPINDGSDNNSNLTLDFGLQAAGSKITASSRSENAEAAIESITNPMLNSTTVSLFPNPANKEVALKVMATKSGSGVARITDQSGRLIASKNVMLGNGLNVVKFDQLEGLATGTYHVQLLFNYQTYNQKLVVVK